MLQLIYIITSKQVRFLGCHSANTNTKDYRVLSLSYGIDTKIEGSAGKNHVWQA